MKGSGLLKKHFGPDTRKKCLKSQHLCCLKRGYFITALALLRELLVCKTRYEQIYSSACHLQCSFDAKLQAIQSVIIVPPRQQRLDILRGVKFPFLIRPEKIIHSVWINCAITPLNRMFCLLSSKQCIHIFQCTSFCLGIKQPDDGYADKIDGHEEKVNVGSDAMDANRPDVGDQDGSNGTARRRHAEPPGAYGVGEDLFVSLITEMKRGGAYL